MVDIASALDGVVLIEIGLSEVVMSCEMLVFSFDEAKKEALVELLSVKVVPRVVDVGIVAVDTVLPEVIISHMSLRGATT